jgi:hypothetical protein
MWSLKSCSHFSNSSTVFALCDQLLIGKSKCLFEQVQPLSNAAQAGCLGTMLLQIIRNILLQSAYGELGNGNINLLSFVVSL